MGIASTIGPQSYAGWRASELGHLTERIEDDLLFTLMGDTAGRRVLDVGCGDGSLARKLHAHGAAVTGIDADPDMVVQARAHPDSAGIAFAVADGARLPFAAATFDTVLAKTVLCFVTDADAVVGEMARVLRPGGRFVIGELGRWSTWAVQRRLRAWLGSTLWRHARFRTASELQALASNAGLDVDTVRGAVYYPRWAPAARLLARWDGAFAQITSIGAAFLAMTADKPVRLQQIAPFSRHALKHQ